MIIHILERINALNQNSYFQVILSLKNSKESSNVRRVSQTNFKDNCEVHASKISRNKIRTWH